MCDSSSATKMVRSLIVLSLPRSPTWNSFTQIKLKPERTALADLALHEDAAFVDGLHNVLHERQPQARPFGHAVVRLCPVELIEHKRQVLGWNPDACIGDAGDHLRPALVDLRDYRNLAADGGVLSRIAQQFQHRVLLHVSRGSGR